MSKITAAVIQQPGIDDYDEALRENIDAINRACDAGANLVLLPELHTGPYFCQTETVDAFERSETIPGPTTYALCEIAKAREAVIVGSIFEQRAPGLYHNTAVVIDSDGSIAGTYRKMHIPDDPGYYEKFYFTPGDMGFTPIQTSLGKLGVLVCWDQWFPEAARLMALAGAQLLLYPTAIGWVEEDNDNEQTRQRDAWQTVQRGHAIANGMPVLVANRVGFEENPDDSEKGIDFWGSSFICGPQGELLAQASSDESMIAVAEVDLAKATRVRQYWPFLRDRRIDAYSNINKLFID